MGALAWVTVLVVFALQWGRGCLGAIPTCSLTLTVEENGKDDHECLSGRNPCKLLDYVLDNIHMIHPNCSEGGVKVIIGYNHRIGPGLAYANLSSRPEIIHLEVGGSNPVNVSCDSSSGLIMAGTPNVSLVFRNLFFNGCIYQNSTEYSSTPFFILVSGFDSVEIDRCSITESAAVRFEFIRYGIIKSSVFSRGTLNTSNELVYTSFALECDCNELLVENTIFLNNNPRGGLGIRNCNGSITTIRGCLFDHNLPGLQVGRDFRLTTGSDSRGCMQFLLLRDTTFTRNPRALFVHSSNMAQISLNSSNNSFIKRGNLFSLGGAVVITPSVRSNLSLTFTHDFFVGNESPLGGMIWFNSALRDNTDITRISTKFSDCTFKENKAGDGAVLYSNVKNPNIFISFSNCYIANNQIILRESTVLYSGIIHTQGGELTLANCTLADNSGTALVLDSTQVSFEGTVNITGNVGTLGGAIHWLTSFNISAKHNSTVLLTNNIASKGGGIYFGNMDSSSNYSCNGCFLNFSLVDNMADSFGHSLYFEDQGFINSFYTNWRSMFDIQSSLNGTVASSVKSIGTTTTSLSLFPGERISVNVIAVDYWGQNTSCDAQFALLCDGIVCRRQDQPQLEGDSLYAPLLYIQAINPGEQQTSLKIASSEGPLSVRLQLVFWCEYEVNNASVAINLTGCPEGFYYNPSTHACKCQQNSNNLACSVEYGVACIKQGYWFGQLPNDTDNSTDAQYIVAPCDPKYCSSSSLHRCPSQVAPIGSNLFFALPREDLDEQCENNQGGFLCYDCRTGYQFTFQAVRCISQASCHPWQPPILILFTLVYQLATITFIVLALRMKLKVGSGVLYGPLLALVVTNLLLNSCHSPNFIFLQVTVTTLSSLLQLNPEFYGYIPWCFIDTLGRLGNYTLRYLSPVIIGLSLLLLACIARRFPRVLSAVQRSPVQLVCLLLLLTFLSLTETTFMLLIPVKITGVPGVRVFTDPQVSYFHDVHIIMALLAIGVAVVFIIPFTTILLVSPFCRAKLHRISPILDEFQSCYKDKYRWYSAVYLIFWVAISISHQLSPTAVQIELVILAILQLLVQPYAKRWLNTMDNMIITNLVLLSALLGKGNSYCDVTGSELLAGTILIYLLVLSLVSIIPFGILFFLVYRCYHAYLHSKAIKPDPLLYYEIIDNVPPVKAVSSTQVSINDLEELVEDREPVIAMEQSKKVKNGSF